MKNKVAAPFREAEFDIIYGEGISREGDLIDLGVTNGVLEKSGTWISYKGERLGQGRENARAFLKENTDIRDKIEHELRKQLGLLAHPRSSSSTETASRLRARAPKAAADAAKPAAESSRRHRFVAESLGPLAATSSRFQCKNSRYRRGAA